MLAVVSVLVFEFILQPMCRSLKRSTIRRHKILTELCSKLQAVNV